MNEIEHFDDATIDRLMGTVLALAGEVYVLRDRVQALEEVLEQTRILQPGTIERLQLSPERQAALAPRREAFFAHLTGEGQG